jgi:spermidine synthase
MSNVIEPVDTGIAELVVDQQGGWTLLVDGVEQSYVMPEQPRELAFAYLRRIASVIDTAAASHTPQRVLHLGGGALSLPRYVAATRPGSPQVVVEHDAALVALVTRVLPLPVDADIRVHVGDARAFVRSGTELFDIVIADVYEGGHMPVSVANVEFARDVARCLAPGGLLAVNVADLPPLTLSRVYAATLRATFADVGLIAEPGLLRGRRYGNVVLVASGQAQRLPVARLGRIAAADRTPARVLRGAALDAFIGATGPRIETT